MLTIFCLIGLHNFFKWQTPEKNLRGLLVSLFQAFFQCGAVQGGQVDSGKAVFAGKHKGFRQIVTGNDLAFLFRCLQKFPGSFGCGGVVQIKDAYDGFLPDSHIIADGQIHNQTPFSFFHSATASSSQRLFFGLEACPLTQ